jgi:hypothetical protein
MCVAAMACPPQFCLLNQQLAEYAALQIDSAGNAIDVGAECRILAIVRQEMNNHVQFCIRRELQLPPVGLRLGATTENSREQRAEDAAQDFWALFITRLRKQRTRGGPPVVVCALNFIHWLVVRVLRWRGLSPLNALNSAVTEYLAPGVEREHLEELVRDAIRRCCGLLLETERRPNKLTAADIQLIADATTELLRLFIAGEIWNTAVSPPRLRTAGDPASPKDFQRLPGRIATVVYVTLENFRLVAAPLLDLAPPPPTPVPLSLPPTSQRDIIREIITRRCEDLAAMGDGAALQRLCVLLFRPYYATATQFCTDFTENGFTFHNAAVSTSQVYWVEQMAVVVREFIPDPQAFITLVRADRDRFALLIASLIDYNVLCCCPAAQRELPNHLRDSCRVLSDFWRLAIGERLRRHPDAWGRFFQSEEKESCSPRVVTHRAPDSLEILTLNAIRQGGSCQ